MNSTQIKSQLIGYIEQRPELKEILKDALPHNMSIKEHLIKMLDMQTSEFQDYIDWITKQEFYPDIVYIAMEHIANIKGVKLSEHADKIALAKSRMNNSRMCPCDAQNPDRYCISDLCMSDIKKNGKCHCGAYIKDLK